MSRLLAEATTAELARRTVGQQRDVVIAALLAEARATVADRIEVTSAELAARSGLPPAAVRTQAGWRKALGRDGHQPSDLSRLSELPGTAVVNLISLLSLLMDAVESIDRAWPDDLGCVWDAPVSTGSFDATVAELTPAHPWASELGWALIGFETHKHINLVWHQANKLERSFPDREAADMLGWGWVGLRTALRHYNPNLGFTFSTYACTRIIGSIRDGVRAENPVPKRLNTFSRKVAATEADLTQTLGRAPTPEEVSASIGVELDALALVRRTAPQASIDEIMALLSDRGKAPSWLVTDLDPAEEALLLSVREEVSRALATLSGDDALAVRLLVMDGLTPTEARLETGATARQLRQRKERGLLALREALAHWDDEDHADS